MTEDINSTKPNMAENHSSHTPIDWDYHVQAQAMSGLSKAEYARLHNLSLKLFYYHSNKGYRESVEQFKKVVIKPENTAEIQPQTQPELNSTQASELPAFKCILPTGIVIEFQRSLTSTLNLKLALSAIQEALC